MKRVGQSIFILLFLTGPLWAATSGDYYAASIRLYQQRQYAKSIQYFRAATQLDPQNWKAYQVMGHAYYQMGDRTDAIQMMNLSLQINPSNQPLRQFRNNLSSSTASGGNGNSDNPAVKGGGPFGLGLEIGDPGSGGASGKFWLDRDSAFQPSVKTGAGTVLQLDYLFHDYDVIHPKGGLMPIYFGAGAGLGVGGGVAIEARGVVGLTYIFDRTSLPLDIYVQVVPALWFGGGGVSGLQVYGNLGSRYYFSEETRSKRNYFLANSILGVFNTASSREYQ
jgi:tetratricopeptide (TPR) repeat protein